MQSQDCVAHFRDPKIAHQSRNCVTRLRNFEIAHSLLCDSQNTNFLRITVLGITNLGQYCSIAGSLWSTLTIFWPFSRVIALLVGHPFITLFDLLLAKGSEFLLLIVTSFYNSSFGD